jgi:hypothetical protein
VRRRTLLKSLAAATVPIAGCDGNQSSASSGSPGASGPVSLAFDKSKYTVQTKTVSTDSGNRKVTYHFYEAIPYVAYAVDKKYRN